MSKFDVPQFVEGDSVTDGTDHAIIVKSYPRKSDGKTFLMARLLTGGRKGQRVWPNGFRPVLDHGDGPSYRCAECAREFRRTVLGREIWCLTCVTAHDAEDRARETDVGVTHQFGTGARKARRE